MATRILRLDREGPPSTKPKGFTLLELLAVIAIIALLIAVLLPSLRNAREQTRRVKCVANLRGIATASLTYANTDSQEHAVPVHPLTGVIPSDSGAYDWGSKAGRGEPTVAEDSLSSIWGTQSGRGPGTRPLNAVLYKSAPTDYRDDPGTHQANWIGDYGLDFGIFRCPSDRGYTGHHFRPFAQSRLTSYDHYGNSYYANTFGGALVNAVPIPPRSWYISIAPFFRPLTMVPNAANTLYYWENCGRYAWHLPPGASIDTTPCYGHRNHGQRTRPVLGWHSRSSKFSATFVDGHAGVINMEGFRYPPPRQSRYPFVNGFAGPQEGFWAEENWRCAIIRGDDWQLDTVPASAMFTSIPADLHTAFDMTIE